MVLRGSQSYKSIKTQSLIFRAVKINKHFTEPCAQNIRGMFTFVHHPPIEVIEVKDLFHDGVDMNIKQIAN